MIMIRAVLAVAALATVAGCAGPDMPPATGAGAHACNISGGGRDRTFFQFNVSMRNQGQWCAFHFAISGSGTIGRGTASAAIEQAPSHGEATVKVTPDNRTLVSYRPQRGFTGGGNFSVEDNPTRTITLVAVNVGPPAE
jgi:hypothetical protein